MIMMVIHGGVGVGVSGWMGVLDEMKAISSQLGLGFGLSLTILEDNL